MNSTLTFIVSCKVLGLLAPFVGSCQGHTMSKWCHHAMKDSKYVGLTSILIKKTQSILQNTITRTKKSGKGWQEWQKACSNVGVPPCKLKTLVKTRFASSMSLPFTMEGNNHWCFEVVHQVHKFGQLPKLFMILQGPWSNNVCWTKVQTTSYFLITFLQQYDSYVKCKWILWHQIPNETQNFDGELQISNPHMKNKPYKV
jgi:hypothetical protein